ncbi:MAG TPA: YajQ family cyclic di-GMP-binding protein [Pseudomonadales bacterium]|nr:YajQ family cyclic di-GMP-binding protein [Pseudomonadales bacterium]
MPSFDIVSELDKHQLTNAIDQASRIVTTRFDFKGVDARFERADKVVTMIAEADIQIQQMLDILRQALLKCGIDIACMDIKEPEQSGKTVRQVVTLREGLDQELAKRVIKLIKEKKMKVQAAIQGEQVRVTGKKRDDLQEVIALLRAEKDSLDMPLQFNNFRD